ncbi:MAG: hypothetical protein QOI54_1998 [Actinomycetota bacterium]|jgi:hypothetical protein|nr:hypothetical protein [Actinomycetota bacterium]
MTTGAGTRNDNPGDPGTTPRGDAVAVPLSLLLWALVLIALAYGVISTLQKVTQLFG